ncbi:MAG: MarR family transcriptional regulator [Actinomycetaceae bacterium]|nr:MarR family transcriptional regulator [Actinomycetaceae bacterium]
MSIASQQLFVELLHRLGTYGDACVLYSLLQRHADEREYKTSMTVIATAIGISRQQVHRAIKRLEAMGLVRSRAQSNYRTCVTVDREAVSQLMRQPIPENLPGINNEVFPFLANYIPTEHDNGIN